MDDRKIARDLPCQLAGSGGLRLAGGHGTGRR